MAIAPSLRRLWQLHQMLLPGLEPGTFCTQVRRLNHLAKLFPWENILAKEVKWERMWIIWLFITLLLNLDLVLRPTSNGKRHHCLYSYIPLHDYLTQFWWLKNSLLPPKHRDVLLVAWCSCSCCIHPWCFFRQYIAFTRHHSVYVGFIMFIGHKRMTPSEITAVFHVTETVHYPIFCAWIFFKLSN